MRIFEEKQKFTQLWVHILLVIGFIPAVVMITRDWIHSSNDDAEVKMGFFVVIGTMILVYALIFSLKLKTRIDEKGIYYRFIPFHFSIKFIPWNEINKAYARK